MTDPSTVTVVQARFDAFLDYHIPGSLEGSTWYVRYGQLCVEYPDGSIATYEPVYGLAASDNDFKNPADVTTDTVRMHGAAVVGETSAVRRLGLSQRARE